jgi:hypothetical protein
MDFVPLGRTYAVGWGTLALINAGLAQSRVQAGCHRVTASKQGSHGEALPWQFDS